MSAKAAETKSEPEPTFESALERLEALVEQMESDKLPLEDLIVRYEEGVKLVKLCSEKLSATEKRIEMITRGASGKAELTEFNPASQPGPKPKEDVSLF